MDVRITKNMFDALIPVMSQSPFSLEKGDWNWKDHFWFDISDFKAQDLEKILVVCDAHPKIRGLPAMGRDIRAWIAARRDGKKSGTIRARNVRQAMALLTEYIRSASNHHIYERVQHGNDGVMLAYFVCEFRFKEGDRRDGTPESFTMTAGYSEFGIKKKESWYFDPSDCVGLTPEEMLTAQNLFIETDLLRKDYDEFIRKYKKLQDKIGLQCLAVGLADDDGIDGNRRKRDRQWWDFGSRTGLILNANGEPSRVVIDVFREEEKDRTDRDKAIYGFIWRKDLIDIDGETSLDGDMDAKEKPQDEFEIPIHPFVAVFDLKRHKRLRVHVGNLEKYKYDSEASGRLIIPEENRNLIRTLLSDRKTAFTDVIKGKSGGVIVLCQGKPGTGKTLTAEIFAEAMGKALYTVQCSQLGTDPDELESELMKVLARGRRWGAVMLLDEADVYVHERGDDLTQNAIVGVFLRVLEYHSGVLFMTTNRGDLVDDAILSRCTARVVYDVPTKEHQRLIWEVLSEANGIELWPKTLDEIVEAHPKLSGRDIKNLLKLAQMMAADTGGKIDAEMIGKVRMFKPTAGESP